MQTPRDGDEQQTTLGPKVEEKPSPSRTPHDNWLQLPEHPGWVQDQATHAVKRNDQ
jgi:hypothetical protein